MTTDNSATKLIPPDTTRCQATVEIHQPFVMGGRVHRSERCRNPPVVIVTEMVPGKDGLIGSMALCAECLEIFYNQDNRQIRVTVIKPT